MYDEISNVFENCLDVFFDKIGKHRGINHRGRRERSIERNTEGAKRIIKEKNIKGNV